jgi:4,5:9,10-diseco-3-hydroxy-5,9,17-trioxoandrosta-1(10),2-diene-4-oate hydrolase
MRAEFVDVAGVRTRLLTAGDPSAYPILMLHGYGGTADVWFRNIDELGRDHYVVAADMVGSGFTDAANPESGPPHPKMLRHIQQLVEQFGWTRLCVMGTSFGSLISALLYFAMPTRVEKLILIGSGSCFNDDDRLRASYRNLQVNFGPLMAKPTLEGCRQSMVGMVYHPSTVPEEILPVMLTAYALPGMLKSWQDGVTGMSDIEASRPYQIRHRLESLDVDTLVLWGREDKGAVFQTAVEAVERMPKAKMVAFEECGHKPMLEVTDQFHRAVREFLGKS